MGRKVNGSFTAPACNISPVYQDATYGKRLQPLRRTNQPSTYTAFTELRYLRRELQRTRIKTSTLPQSPSELSLDRECAPTPITILEKLKRLDYFVVSALAAGWTLTSSIVVHNTRVYISRLRRNVGNAVQHWTGLNTGEHVW